MTREILTKRSISHEEAAECLRRFCGSHFRDGRPVARIGIPARPDYDDDLLLSAYISQQQRVTHALEAILATVKSHVDGRDLLDELHPRKTLDIKRRVDGVETWFEADWLSRLRDAVIKARAVLAASSDPGSPAMNLNGSKRELSP